MSKPKSPSVSLRITSADPMTATCPRCRATVEVRTMKSLLLLGEPDEAVRIAVSHMRPRSRVGSGETRCEGSNEEVPVPYVPRPMAVVPVAARCQGARIPTGTAVTSSVAPAVPTTGQPTRNRYAAAGRAEKVRKLLDAIDAQILTSPHAPKSPQEIAERLAEVDMATWAKFAKQIGVNAPSAETISEVLTVYRAKAIHANEVEQRKAVGR